MPLLLHTIGHDLKKLEQDGCKLANPPRLFNALMIATKLDPCTTGCAYFNDGKCPAYLKYHSTPLDKQYQKKEDFKRSHSDQSGLVSSGLSIKQIAAKEGISISEVRRRKQAGQYK